MNVAMGYGRVLRWGVDECCHGVLGCGWMLQRGGGVWLSCNGVLGCG